MTATLTPQPNTTGLAAALAAEKKLHEDAEREVTALRAGIAAIIDELVDRAQILRQNNGHYPPTENDLAEVADATARYWLGIATAAASPAVP